ncbi:Tyrosine recombinase XerC [subsurface metagenome]
MRDLVSFDGPGDELQKQAIARIKTIEDSHSAAAGRYYAWLAKTEYGFVDGLEAYLVHLRKTYQAARTIRAYFFAAKNRVRALMPFLLAGERGQLLEYLQRLNPDKSDIAVEADKILSGEEIDRLVETLHGGSCPIGGADTIGYAAEFLKATACRISEMLDARWTDVLDSGPTVYLRVHGKGKKERVIPFTETDLLERLRRHFQGETWLFEHEKKQYTRGYISPALTHAGREIIGRKISAHTFRHSTLTRMIKKGIPIKAVSKFAGHGSTAITNDLYIHVSVEPEDLLGLWKEEKKP